LANSIVDGLGQSIDDALLDRLERFGILQGPRRRGHVAHALHRRKFMDTVQPPEAALAKKSISEGDSRGSAAVSWRTCPITRVREGCGENHVEIRCYERSVRT